MPTPTNLITKAEIHTRTELWKDKIYYISNNPYWNKDYQFLPLPSRFTKVLKEFQTEVQNQKREETTENERKAAQERINEIYLEIRGIIEEEIESENLLDLEETSTEEEKIEWAKNKQARIKNLKLGANKKTLSQFRRFNTEHLEDNEQITTLLDEWEDYQKTIQNRKNFCFILEETDQHLKFCYQPPKQIFANLKEFLFCRGNVWYEVLSWERINHENAIITTQRSFFIYNYPRFLSQGGNGMFHNYPLTNNQKEVCQCPSFLESTRYLDFFSDWQPTYSLWQLENMDSGFHYGHGANLASQQAVPYVHTIKLKKLHDPADFNRDLKQATLFTMPKNYDGGLFYREQVKIANFQSKDIDQTLKEWAKSKKIVKGEEGEHLLKHCTAQFFWNSKLIYTACLDDLDLEHMEILIRANPSDIIYLFQSRKTFFRWSEDVQFNIDRDIVKEMALDAASQGVQQGLQGVAQGAATGGAVGGAEGALVGAMSGLVGGLFNMAKGNRKTINSSVQANLHNQIQTTESKAQDEGQTERKTKYVGTANIVGAAIGSLPSILNPSHTKNDYTIAEFALRFNLLNFQMRVEYNQNLIDRYLETKQLKKSCNYVFQTQKFGSLLKKGYIKLVPIIFEGDREGFFAGIFSRGVYMYEKHPHEFFLNKLEKLQHQNASLRQDASATITTVEENLSTSIGHDNQTDFDGMSWVWKDSYCRGGGEDLFPQLISHGSSHVLLDVPPHGSGSSSCPKVCTQGCKEGGGGDPVGNWRFDATASWSSSGVKLKKGVQYGWFINAFSSGEKDSKILKGLDDLRGLFDNLIIMSNDKDHELEKKGRKIRELKELLGKSKEEIIDYKLKIKEGRLETLIQKLEVDRGKIRELKNNYQQLNRAYANNNQDEIEDYGDKIESIRDGLIDGGVDIVNAQKLCQKCEKIAKLKAEQDSLYKEMFEAKQEVVVHSKK